MREFSCSPQEMFACVWRHRSLIQSLAKREILSRYRGSSMGLAWSFFNPLLMLAIYTFVFSEVFKARWNVASESKTEFALVLFAGLIVFNIFSECITRAPSLVLANPNYVKKVVFPLEILPVANVLAAGFHGVISLGVWLLAYGLFYGVPPATGLLLPVVLAPLFIFIMGVSWFLSSMGVYLRDVGQVIGVLITGLMFLSPIFYPVTALPGNYQALLLLNPLTPMIEQTRAVLFWGNYPNPLLLLACWGVSLIVAWIGFFWFQKTRRGFADVI